MSDETEVGNYFISNYPPFSFWGQEHADEARAAINRPNPETPLGLYLHIPFCRKRCKFCYFRVYTDKNANEVEVYLDALAREIELYSQQPVFEGRQFRFVYFGGGTPSYLGSKQLRGLIDRLRKSISWDEAEEVTFECEPGTLKEHKVQALRDIGVTRLSLGVENFSDKVLEENGRAHLSPEVFKAYDWIRAAGFKSVNIDLIAGMVGESWDNWKDCVRKAIEMDPDSVTIYQMELPYNTIYSRAILQDGQESPVATWETKREWVDYAFMELEAAGYIVSSAYTMVKEGTRFVYRDGLWHGADLAGTGVASFGHIGGVHYQNVDTLDEYVKLLQEDVIPINRALPVTEDQRLIRELILQTKVGRLNADYFRQKFDKDIFEIFGPVYEKYEQENLLKREGDEILLTREGLLRVDSMLPEFFQAQHRDARYT
ncbi:MAG: coproporphyrinogen-III oxidase family protein [Planctomycetota bacterium]|nr:coproporphyrinogen-III oxidase family protein [Planctomycetota bacterium]MDP7250343.1 coproporphyrinogen-III oxidase family protein [Planctomycetota bacterium]